MRRALAAAAVALLAAACAKGTSGPGSDSAKGHLKIDQQIVGPLYVEGSAGYVTVTDNSSNTVYSGTLAKPSTVELPAGSYTVDSYQKLCIGSCAHLGPPIDRCSAAVRIASDATSSATVRLTPTKNACTISVTN